ncbi:hypothetical protein EMCRGX_G024076 [Ephydatia muelleri]
MSLLSVSSHATICKWGGGVAIGHNRLLGHLAHLCAKAEEFRKRAVRSCKTKYTALITVTMVASYGEDHSEDFYTPYARNGLHGQMYQGSIFIFNKDTPVLACRRNG